MSRDAPLHDLVSGEEGDIKKMSAERRRRRRRAIFHHTRKKKKGLGRDITKMNRNQSAVVRATGEYSQRRGEHLGVHRRVIVQSTVGLSSDTGRY
jgi:hypothetical protein